MKMKLLSICKNNLGKLKNDFKLRNILPVLALIFLFVAFTILNPRFASMRNLTNILRQTSALLIIGTGATFVILSGNIDLSLDGLIALSGISSVMVANSLSSNPFVGWISILVGMVVGLIFGTIIGLIVSNFQLPSFLVTFGFSTIASGLGLIITNGKSIPTFTDAFNVMASGSFLGIPNIACFSGAILIIGIFIGKKTRFGRYIYALGGSERVAELCSIPIKKYKTFVFMFAGAMTGLGGSLMSSRIGAASNVLGNGMALDTIAAVVMGGTALSGGKGSVLRTILGVMIIILLRNGLNVLGVSTHIQIVVKGVVVILAVAMTMGR